jgi:hypothetical protein
MKDKCNVSYASYCLQLPEYSTMSSLKNIWVTAPSHATNKKHLARCDKAHGIEARFLFHIDPKYTLKRSGRDRRQQKCERVQNIRGNVRGVEVVTQETRGAGHT